MESVRPLAINPLDTGSASVIMPESFSSAADDGTRQRGYSPGGDYERA
jgi:hypothetical protein